MGFPDPFRTQDLEPWTDRSPEHARRRALGCSHTKAQRRHIVAFMRLVHLIEAANQDRPTSRLDLRARVVIQHLGLSGPTSILGIRQSLNLSPSTLTSIADRLEKGGYVRRRPHPTDRRGAVLELTAKGRRAFDGEIGFYERLIDQGLDPLGDDATPLCSKP